MRRLIALLALLSTCALTGCTSDDPPVPPDLGCASLVAVQANPSPADPSVHRWVALRWACLGHPAPRTVEWYVNGAPVGANPVGGGDACLLADGPTTGPFSAPWVIEVKVGGIVEDTLELADLPAQDGNATAPDTALTWVRTPEDTWIPNLPAIPGCP